MAKLFSGVTKKEAKLSNICKEFKVIPEEIAYIGDDVNDIESMKRVGLATSPNDGMREVIRLADYVCEKNGGEGVLREIAELILSAR